MHGRLLSILGVLLVGLLCWGLVGPGRPPAPRPALETPDAPRPEAAREPARDVPPDRAELGAVDAVTPTPGGGGHGAPARDTFRVRVVDGPGGPPVAAAQVWHFDRGLRAVLSDPAARGAMTHGWNRDMRFLRRFGAAIRTDRQGIARLPDHGWGLHCIVEAGGRRAARIEPATRPGPRLHTLALQPDQTITLRVLRADRRPAAGARILARRALGPREVPLVVGTTDAQGEFCLDHLRERQRRWPRTADGRPRTRLQVEVPGAEIGVDVFFDDLPTAPVELTLPPTGSAEIRLVGPAGVAAADAYGVALQLDEPGTHPHRLGPAIQRLRQGRALFPFVALGVTLRTSVRVRGQTLTRSFAGPTSPVAPAVTTLRMPHDDFLLRGRAVDGARRPFAGCRIRARVRSQTGAQVALADGWTDRDGRFCIQLCGALDQASWGAVRVTAIRRGESFACPGPVLWQPAPGITDLGNLFLLRDPELLRGQVVDGAGEPVAGATVSAHRPGGEGFRARTAADGTFAIHGRPDALRPEEYLGLQVRAAAPGWASGPWLTCRPGDTGIQLRMRPVHAFTCRTRATAPANLATEPTAHLRPAAGGAAGSGSPTLPLALRGRRRRDGNGWTFDWPEVPAGTYRAEIDLGGRIVVEAPVRVPDDRSVTVDLPAPVEESPPAASPGQRPRRPARTTGRRTRAQKERPRRGLMPAD